MPLGDFVLVELVHCTTMISIDFEKAKLNGTILDVHDSRQTHGHAFLILEVMGHARS